MKFLLYKFVLFEFLRFQYCLVCVCEYSKIRVPHLAFL